MSENFDFGGGRAFHLVEIFDLLKIESAYCLYLQNRLELF